MFDTENITPMSDEEFVSIRNFVYDHCGMYFEKDRKYLLEKRLSRRLVINQIPTFTDYLLFLKYDQHADEEVAIAVDLLTINETYFFRENYQLQAFIKEIIPELVKKKKDKTIRIWSAGCSTGEEPYTLAMLISNATVKLGIEDWNIEILGSDISHRVLSVAREGVYSKSSFRETDESYLSFFDKVSSGYRVKDELRKNISFIHLNLLDKKRIGLLKTMDVILCRNVIIYFDVEAKKKVVQSFHETLDKGGYLLLGHSESLMNVSTLFGLKHLKNDMVYQKPGGENTVEDTAPEERERITDFSSLFTSEVAETNNSENEPTTNKEDEQSTEEPSSLSWSKIWEKK
ncbi:MAG: protein-glutamate O-methyltransferase CheR [Deltaproteobacteria bacterium]|nr:protein-glutamate O-methyltransferase CheR [Deltaproteobacteria bacterium]